MYVGGLTALWTNDHDNAGILGCLRIDLEFMAAAVDTPDKAERKGPLYAPDPFISHRVRRCDAHRRSRV
jgi:hypothetical protein